MKRFRVVAGCLLLAVGAIASPASAQRSSGKPAAAPPTPAASAPAPESNVSSENRALAETLFFTARGLMEAERYPAACRKLEESYRLDPAAGTLLNLALCHEKEGKIASAWGEYRQALVEARRANRKEREDVCTERVAALQPLVPMLRIDVSEEARRPGLVVYRNGVALNDAAWGTPLPTDPGPVELTARAPGFKPWTTKFEIKVHASEQVAVGPLEKEDVPVVARAGGAGAASPGWPAAKTIGLAAGITGVVVAGVGLVLGQLAIDKRKDSDSACPVRDDERRCTADGVDKMSQANTLAWGSNIAIAVGGIALVGGGILFFTAPRTDAKASPGASASLVPGVGSAHLRVTF